jgi:hypothetical protein
MQLTELRSTQEDRTESFHLLNSDTGTELQPFVCVKKTEIREHLVDRFMKFSSWNGLVRAVSCLKRFCRGKAKLSPRSIKDTQEAERFIIRETQNFWYGDDIRCLKEKKPLSPRSSTIALHPLIDHDGYASVVV